MPLVVVCQYSSRFYLISPAIDCGDRGTPTNGQHSLSSTTYNSVVTYTCDVGHTCRSGTARLHTAGIKQYNSIEIDSPVGSGVGECLGINMSLYTADRILHTLA